MTDTNPGETNYSAAEAVTRAQSYGSWQTNMCMNFVWYQLSYAHVYGIADAYAGWDMAHNKHTGSDAGNPPAGAPVYWSTAHPYGHVALSVGGGKVRSTDWPSKGDVGTVTIDQMTAAWGMHLLGWTEDLCGDRIPGLLEEEDDVTPQDVDAIVAGVVAAIGPDTDETHKRVMGMLNQRFYIVDEDGTAYSVDRDEDGAKTGHALDTIDGNSLRQAIDRGTAKTDQILAELEAAQAHATETRVTVSGLPHTVLSLVAVLSLLIGAALALAILR